MGNFRAINMLRNGILCFTTASFIACSIQPVNAHVNYAKAIDFNLNDVAFIYRLEKLVERVKRYKEKLENGKLIEVMLEIKMEVEAYTGKRVSTSEFIDQIERDAKRQGATFKPGEIRTIKNIVHRADKKKGHRALYLHSCNMNDIDFNEIDYQFLAKSAHKSKKHDKEEKEVVVPIRMQIGVVCALCGYFLQIIPHPYAQGASKILIGFGVSCCAESAINRLEEDENKQKEGN